MVGGSHKMPRVSGAEREARDRMRDDRQFNVDERPQPGRGMDEQRRMPPESGQKPMGGDFRRQNERFPEQRSMPEPPPPPQSTPRREGKLKSFKKKSGCCLFSLIGIMAVIAAGIAAVL